MKKNKKEENGCVRRGWGPPSRQSRNGVALSWFLSPVYRNGIVKGTRSDPEWVPPGHLLANPLPLGGTKTTWGMVFTLTNLNKPTGVVDHEGGLTKTGQLGVGTPYLVVLLPTWLLARVAPVTRGEFHPPHSAARLLRKVSGLLTHCHSRQVRLMGPSQGKNPSGGLVYNWHSQASGKWGPYRKGWGVGAELVSARTPFKESHTVTTYGHFMRVKRKRKDDV